MGSVCFSALNLNRQDLATQFNQEIQLSALFVVVIVWRYTVGNKFLSNGVLVNGSVVDIGLPLDNAQLDTSRVLCSQQPNIALKKFEQVT